MAEETKNTLSVADPAPLGLGAFGLTTFVLNAHNALGGTVAPLLAFFGFAIIYGGLAQFMAGMYEFKNRNAFGATAFTTYGAFWMGLATFVALVLMEKVKQPEIGISLGWILLAFAIFNTYMLFWSTRINVAVFLVFLTLEVTEILLFIGNFKGEAAGTGWVALGGWIGILTALVAWYTSAAALVNGMAGRSILPVGGPLWTGMPGPAHTAARAGAHA